MARGTAILAMVVAFFVMSGGAVAQSAGSASGSGREVIHLKFQRVFKGTSEDVQAVLASKQYVVVQLFARRYRVYDDARGKSWRIDTRPCGSTDWPRDQHPTGVGSFGTPWVMFSCSTGPTAFALYNVIDRSWRRIGSGSAGTAFEDATAFEVGAFWIKLVYTGGQDCGDHIHFGCGVRYRFYNIRSRRFRSSPPMSPSTVFDLDSPSLARQLCEPLQAPPTDRFGVPMGSLALYGKFALEFAHDIGFLNNTAPGGAQGEWTLQRCGSNTRLSIDVQNQGQNLGALTANGQAVLWSIVNSQGIWTGQVAGRFLRGLGRFVASMPRVVSGSNGGAVLGSSRVYAVSKDGASLWRASFPH